MADFARKICLLGDFGVGKSSLVARFVRNTFSDRYLTTVGVKVDSKQVVVANDSVKLVIWDIAGKSALDALNQTYLRGASGVILVADGTREPTLRSALYLLMQAKSLLQNPAAVMLVNKIDLIDRWEILPATLEELRKTMPVYESSAVTGDGVDAAFQEIARQVAQ